MPRVGVSITKSTPFRNSVQEFSNVYYYQNTGSLPSAAGADAMIDELTAFEKTIHSTQVTFVRGRLWSQEGSPGANEMISQKTLSGTGAAAQVSSMDKERAFLVRWRAGNDSRGNPVYLRKWWHSCGSFDASVVIGSSQLEQSAALSAGSRTAIENKSNNINTLTSGGGGWELVAKSGRQRTSGAANAHQFLEHHQFGDMW